MPMDIETLDGLLREGFPDADIQIDDLRGDGDHYAVKIISPAFEGKSRIQQHQLVYAALKGKMTTELHALAIQTATPTSTTNQENQN